MAGFYERLFKMHRSDHGRIDGHGLKAELAFLTRDPMEHHQLVLIAGKPDGIPFNVIIQISFRVDSLADLRAFWNLLPDEKEVSEIYAYVTAGIRVQELARAQAFIDKIREQARFDPAVAAWIGERRFDVIAGWAGLIVLLFIIRWARTWINNRRDLAKIVYRHFDDSRTIDLRPGWSVLGALRAAEIPNPAVCGGRGRCTTCKVKIGAGMDELPSADALELRALERISAPPNVRLACQVRPTSSLEITPLLPPSAVPADGFLKPGYQEGKELQVAILFADLRESTKLAEDRMPFDVVFILNQFFAELSSALAETGGHYAQFNGDGLMAFYGLETDLPTACTQALNGAERMFERMENLNKRFETELVRPLRMGIGIHAGDAVVGSMGPPATPIISALGDNVNIAARLEAQTKELGAPLVVSAITAAEANFDVSGCTEHIVAIRGRDEPLTVYAVEKLGERASAG